jgi:hypothetical protein
MKSYINKKELSKIRHQNIIGYTLQKQKLKAFAGLILAIHTSSENKKKKAIAD